MKTISQNRGAVNAGLIDTAELRGRIAGRAKDYLADLFGNAVESAGKDKWRVGKRGSLAISIQDGALVFFSHEEGKGGDAIELWQRKHDVSVVDALKGAAAWAGLGGTVAIATKPDRRAALPTRPKVKPAPALLTAAQRTEANAMNKRLAGDLALCELLAKERGWTVEAIRGAALDGALGWHEGKLAFIYADAIKLRWQEGEKRMIRHYCGAAHSLWRGWMKRPTTSRVYICEGETDVLCLLSQGWEQNPADLVVAIPNAYTIPEDIGRQFAGCHVWLMADQDEAGQKAAEKLIAALGKNVASLKKWKPQ